MERAWTLVSVWSDWDNSLPSPQEECSSSLETSNLLVSNDVVRLLFWPFSSYEDERVCESKRAEIGIRKQYALEYTQRVNARLNFECRIMDFLLRTSKKSKKKGGDYESMRVYLHEDFQWIEHFLAYAFITKWKICFLELFFRHICRPWITSSNSENSIRFSKRGSLFFIIHMIIWPTISATLECCLRIPLDNYFFSRNTSRMPSHENHV